MRLQTNHILNLINDPFRLRAGQVNLIDDRQHVQVMVESKVDVGQRLRLNPLRRIHYQDRAVTGRKAAGYLIVKVDMAGGINQVKNILFPILGPVYNTDSLRLDRNPALPLQIHVVQHLRLHLAAGQ